MAATRVSLLIDERLLRDVDRWVAAGDFADRDVAVQTAINELRTQRLQHRRLLTELEKLDRGEERSLAEEQLSAEASWPAY